jgi:hypothetical protein
LHREVIAQGSTVCRQVERAGQGSAQGGAVRRAGQWADQVNAQSKPMSRENSAQSTAVHRQVIAPGRAHCGGSAMPICAKCAR